MAYISDSVPLGVKKMKMDKTAILVLGAMGLTMAQDTVNVLTPYEAQQGFELLFDGTANSFRNLFADYQQNNTTSTSLNAGWTASNGAIVNGSANRDIRSRKMYRNFDWRFEYKNPGNQGIFYRFDASGQYAWYTGIEFAIDDALNQAADLTAGSAYDLIAPAQPNPYKTFTTGQWNKLRIVAKNDSIEHWMNDVKVVAFKYWGQSFLASFPSSKWSGTAYQRYCQTANNNRTYIPMGYIGIQGDHGGAWQIRKMRILHDSLTTQDRVQYGPITTVSSLGADRARKDDFRIELGVHSMALRFKPMAAAQVVKVHDLKGALVHSSRVPAHAERWTMDTRALQKGLYLLQVAGADGSFSTRVAIP
jgi:Domain of Unknown Function (DUF1080)